MRVVNAALAIMLICMPAMAEDRFDEQRRRRRSSRADEARRGTVADRLREQAIKDIKRADEARKKAIEKASLEMIKGLFKKAKAADKAEIWGTAYSHYHDVSSSRAPGAESMVTQSRTRMNELDGVAEERVRQARRKELYRQYPEAVSMYRAVTKEFGFSRHAEEARRRIAFLLRSNTVAPALLLAEAEDLEKAKEYLGAKARYKNLAVKYPRSVEAITARRKLDKFDRDIVITESVEAALAREAREKAPGMLRMAENFLRNEMSGRARHYLDMIIKKYPKTEWADKARAKLEGLE